MLKNFGNKKKNEKKGENNKDVTGSETEEDHLQYLKALENFIFSTEKLGIDGLVKQYRKLDAKQDPSLTYDAYTKYMHKNRYCDVVCLDNSRVKLKIDKSRHGDYIHANYVKTNYLRSTFICSQGPLQHTIIDFWRMIFQERAESILLLCKVGREGRPRYWPSLGVTETYGCIRVTNFSESSEEFEICNLAVTFVPDNVPVDEQPANLEGLRVSLIKWPNWPDCGVPDEKCHTVPQRLLAQVRHGPCVVHCSAGKDRLCDDTGIGL
ncbi:Tyrosine-protein phosphatase domain-containing protein [Caenorhabditis elegans]|uniref:Tyrosine-protein phosphatase domain-containing protein n=1 Tax=Caenorhabditis elegans TaxID=6239 RepID=Q9N520_CAEEL|nr:Tyrosine-protein phosphatase domain-containing protein [Caenorhabditis elegans]CCD73007.2 Tyrosine-protein phosphatase domain-containing protein [Caenorhabditis elegans]